jgi:hypothetical protein
MSHAFSQCYADCMVAQALNCLIAFVFNLSALFCWGDATFTGVWCGLHLSHLEGCGLCGHARLPRQGGVLENVEYTARFLSMFVCVASQPLHTCLCSFCSPLDFVTPMCFRGRAVTVSGMCAFMLVYALEMWHSFVSLSSTANRHVQHCGSSASATHVR